MMYRDIHESEQTFHLRGQTDIGSQHQCLHGKAAKGDRLSLSRFFKRMSFTSSEEQYRPQRDQAESTLGFENLDGFVAEALVRVNEILQAHRRRLLIRPHRDVARHTVLLPRE